MNTLFNLHIFRIEIFLIRQCEHIEDSTDFSFETQILHFFLNFQQQNPLNVFHILALKIVKFYFIKLDSLNIFQNTKNNPKFQCNFQLQFYLIFIEKLVQ